MFLLKRYNIYLFKVCSLKKANVKANNTRLLEKLRSALSAMQQYLIDDK